MTATLTSAAKEKKHVFALFVHKGDADGTKMKKVFTEAEKSLGKEVAALADVNLSIAPGEFVAMVGPSGSGKSTLLLVLGGLIHPDQGEVYLCCTSSQQNLQTPGEACPGCGQKGRAVEILTLKALLRPRALVRLLPGSYLFCRTPACPVVYFANDVESVYRKEDLKVRVGLKAEHRHLPLPAVAAAAPANRSRIFRLRVCTKSKHKGTKTTKRHKGIQGPSWSSCLRVEASRTHSEIGESFHCIHASNSAEGTLQRY